MFQSITNVVVLMCQGAIIHTIQHNLQRTTHGTNYNGFDFWYALTSDRNKAFLPILRNDRLMHMLWAPKEFDFMIAGILNEVDLMNNLIIY